MDAKKFPVKNKNKPIEKPNHARSRLARFKSEWGQLRPIIIFVAIFIGLMIGFYLLWMSEMGDNYAQPMIAKANSKLAVFILNLIGQEVVYQRELIVSNQFSISVHRGCDAIEAMAMFACCVLAFPSKLTKKLIGLICGVLLLFLFNQVRIVSLFLTGKYYPDAIELMHVEVWQAVFIFISVGLFVFWIRWSKSKLNHAV